jgi:pimeloyl-ACP methyl ester carboxylesterase
MPRLEANGIEIEYETFGDPKAAPLLLVSGLGSQLTSFDVEFCEQLRDRGFYVIRYDNRDAGLSTKMEGAGEPDLLAAFGGNATPAYRLEDLADDAAGLLSGLGLRAAHIVGVSMGGFIAQLIAINHPDRVLSLTSIMSGPGGQDEVPPQPEGADVLMRVPPPTRAGQIEHGLWIRKTLKGPGDPFDEAMETRQVESAYDRSYYPVGTGRQLVAILAAESRLEKLRRLKVPVLVIHGTDDVLVPVENGRMVAKAIPGARLLEFEQMGHNLPERVWPQILNAIDQLARQARVPQPH